MRDDGDRWLRVVEYGVGDRPEPHAGVVVRAASAAHHEEVRIAARHAPPAARRKFGWAASPSSGRWAMTRSALCSGGCAA